MVQSWTFRQRVRQGVLFHYATHGNDVKEAYSVSEGIENVRHTQLHTRPVTLEPLQTCIHRRQELG